MEPIYTDLAPRPLGPYSQAMRTGDWLFVSGQVPVDPVTAMLVPGGLSAQVTRVLLNLKCVVEAAGGTLRQVVRTTVYLTDLKDFPEFNHLYGEMFTPPYPARAVVQVAGLPAGARVEIEAVADLSGK